MLVLLFTFLFIYLFVPLKCNSYIWMIKFQSEVQYLTQVTRDDTELLILRSNGDVMTAYRSQECWYNSKVLIGKKRSFSHDFLSDFVELSFMCAGFWRFLNIKMHVCLQGWYFLNRCQHKNYSVQSMKKSFFKLCLLFIIIIFFLRSNLFLCICAEESKCLQ